MIKLLDNWYIGIKTFIKMFKVRDRSKCPYIKKLFPSLFYYENLMWWRFYGEMPMYHVYRRYSKTWVRIPMHVRCIVFERGRLIQKILTKRIIHTWNYENPNIWLGGGGSVLLSLFNSWFKKNVCYGKKPTPPQSYYLIYWILTPFTKIYSV